MDNGTLTPLLKKMEDAGFLTRARSREDERVVTVSLTPQGRELRAAAEDIPRKMGECISLSPEEARSLYALLYQVLGSL
ncbi:Organic hydroperoxide resistance transcriptional regulator [bioreactor metagenome]|uniref:Organic hydroperoxide resistance transcriptional regulator n=1 Tax=bioreactor metagenome TaxID=1076179 RepID=A0A645FV98_9ZZZZ